MATDIRRRILVDFDGTIHSYTNPYNDYQLDPPTEGAIQWLEKAAVKFRPVIFSTRAKDEHGRETILRWLGRNGLSFQPEVTNIKQPAIVLLDDRAIRFEGLFPTDEEIFAAAKPWNKR